VFNSRGGEGFSFNIGENRQEFQLVELAVSQAYGLIQRLLMMMLEWLKDPNV